MLSENGVLGKLEKLDLREVWKDEAVDFTPWIAREDNLDLLSEALGIQLELEDTEVYVGNYKADLVAKDIDSDKTVIIENQLERTDHDHLGKVITYASGLNANIIVWICKQVTDEHRKAIDWLNDITNEEIAFFALEMELWRINNSPIAPKFNVVCSPNEWAKSVKQTAKVAELTETKLLQQDFWNKLKDYFIENGTFLKLRTPRAQHWYSIAIGRSKFQISLTVNTRDNRLGCELYLRGEDAKKSFSLLKQEQEGIEREIGHKLEWQELPDGQDSRIILYSEGNIKDKDKWEQYFKWFKEYSEKFHKAFSARIRKINLD
jgi:hypothetical protein